MGDSDQFGSLPSMWIRPFRFHYVHLAGRVFVEPKRVCGGNHKDLIECAFFIFLKQMSYFFFFFFVIK